jgi:hypothetical protein
VQGLHTPLPSRPGQAFWPMFHVKHETSASPVPIIGPPLLERARKPSRTGLSSGRRAHHSRAPALVPDGNHPFLPIRQGTVGSPGGSPDRPGRRRKSSVMNVQAAPGRHPVTSIRPWMGGRSAGPPRSDIRVGCAPIQGALALRRHRPAWVPEEVPEPTTGVPVSNRSARSWPASTDVTPRSAPEEPGGFPPPLPTEYRTVYSPIPTTFALGGSSDIQRGSRSSGSQWALDPMTGSPGCSTIPQQLRAGSASR